MLLEVNALHVRYGSIAAVRGVSLEVEHGEIVGLIGANGAGKSSILNALAGIVPAAVGTVSFAGEDITNQPPHLISRRGVCLVPEGRRIFGTLSVRENLILAGHRRPRKERREDAVNDVLRHFPGLAPHLNSPAARLSGGEQQQLAIGRALMARPHLLLLDEPSLGLAPQVTDSIFDAFSDLRAEGIALLLVEQNVVRALDIADRTYVIRNGLVVEHGQSDKLLDRRTLLNLHEGVASSLTSGTVSELPP